MSEVAKVEWKDRSSNRIKRRCEHRVWQVAAKAPDDRGIYVVIEPIVALLMELKSLNRLQVNPAASAGTFLAEAIGPSASQFIPETVQTFDVLHFGHADPVRRVAASPIGEWGHIEVQTVESETWQIHETLDDVDQILPCLRKTEVQKDVPSGWLVLFRSQAGWFFANHVPSATRSNSNQSP